MSKNRRVVITGFGGISPLGCDWETIFSNLKSCKNKVQKIAEWEEYKGLNTHLAAPAADFDLPADRYNRKSMRSMGRVALMSCRATDMALEDAGLTSSDIVTSGRTGIAYGSSTGSPEAQCDFFQLLVDKSTNGINASSYIKMMSHTAAVNIAVFFGVTGRVIPTSSACTSGSQAIGYAYEAIKCGHADVMIAGGAEELSPSEVVVFDTLFATSTMNSTPELTPSPFGKDRDGLVIGEGACTAILEEYEHAIKRGAKIYAELVGFGTNCDGTHVTQPQSETMAKAMELALDDADLSPDKIGYVNAHGTATKEGDTAETKATEKVFGSRMPISSLKSYMGHTLGACGALEAWMTIGMMNDGWFAPTLNLNEVDPACGNLQYIKGSGTQIDCDYTMSNNFAFGGINTSLIFKRL